MNVTSAPGKVTAIKRAFINPASIGANAFVTGVPGRGIRVLSVALIASGVTNVKFQSAATDISALFSLAANGGLVLPFNEHGWFQTADGETLNLNLSAAIATGASIQYIVL
jgi:hypothetical protein